MCKMQAPDISVAATHECLILHGHYGYTKDYPVEQRLRDVIGQQIADGTPQIQNSSLPAASSGATSSEPRRPRQIPPSVARSNSPI
jgi:alkylation response protein AidB-like acyl-CoA dehydrogenase